jgi:hypothetical protein
MKTLKINVPEGYEIDKEQSTFENIVFKEIEKGLPKSWEELEKLNGYFVDVNAELIQLNCPSLARDGNRNIFATKEQAEASIALAQLSQLREVYRQGWTTDWENEMQKKWCIRFYKGTLEIEDYCSTNYFFSFQTREIAKQFLENFRSLIEKARPLMS